jgi:putative ATP-dependent endonuclease of the OLD family
VLIVEGDAENILIPALAELLGRPLSKHGVSIVNVGHTGLFRYARIFQRKDGNAMDIRVACIRDLDIPPQTPATEAYLSAHQKKRFDSNNTKEEEIRRIKERQMGEPVITCVSPQWTMEYDIAQAGHAVEMHVAIQLAKRKRALEDGEVKAITSEAESEYRTWESDLKRVPVGSRPNDLQRNDELAARVYRDLYKGNASKTEAAQYFVEVLKRKYQDDPNRAENIRKSLPKYLINAIDYVTRRIDFEAAKKE